MADEVSLSSNGIADQLLVLDRLEAALNNPEATFDAKVATVSAALQLLQTMQEALRLEAQTMQVETLNHGELTPFV